MALGLMLALTGCGAGGPDDADQPVVAAPAPAPEPAPAPPPQRSQADIRQARAEAARAANRAADATTASPASAQLALYLAGVESDLLGRGKLRRDRAPADATYDAEILARNFALIALRDEYGPGGLRHATDSQPAPLRRWSGPVRIQPEFGGSSDTGDRARDRATIAAVAARIARASGHDVGLTASGGNFIVLTLTEDERREIGPRLANLVPGIPASDITAIRDLARGNYCTVFAYSRGRDASYTNAVALIRAELPPRLRASCFEEELAQGMGLANDSPAVRPTVFNDDEEFALLTTHDEALLAILYDPRLRPGMEESQAAPIIRTIAAEQIGGDT